MMRLLAWSASAARARLFIVAGSAAVLASGLGGWAAAGHQGAARAGVPARVARVLHPAGAGTGLSAVAADGHTVDLSEGAAVPCGTTLVTDPRTRARLELADGTVVALDRDTRLTYTSPGEIQLASGSIVADLGASASLLARSALLELHSTRARYALTADDRRASIGVVRGDVVLHGLREDVTVHPGEEAELTAGALRPEITATGDLGQRIAFGEGEAGDGPPSGLGELRARKPGSKDEIDGAVRLSRHVVKARIAGAMARTEIDETFVNTTDRELEGVWRFPLPQGARLERLALEVDGKLVEGEFVDAHRAAGIWRGVIQQATPAAPRPAEEIVWVPGPWRDPALLEWQRGSRAELKIFPIPRKGTRRVVLAYTQHVEPTGGVRRYVYPLAARAGATPIDEASFDVRVVGGDPAAGVRARGYDLTSATPDGSDPSAPHSLVMSRSAFTPAGDLVVEYATSDRATEASAVAFSAPGGQGEDAFVAIALRPRLPSRIAERGRDQVLVVDTGRAMFGERLRRASRMAVELAQQMDRRDRVAVLACDLECRAMPGGWHAPGAACAHDVDAFLAGATADGATDLVGAVRAAAEVPGRARDHDLRVVLLSDGVATAGVRGASRVSAEVAAHLSDPRAEVVAVPIGSDADVDTLSEIAQGGGGAVVPYGAGQALEAAAIDVLSATYGATLRDVELTLPDGLHDIAPREIPPLRAGAETILAARMKGDHAAGDLVLRGKLAGEPFEARWPVDVRATAEEGNAWAARTWAAGRVSDDERAGTETARTEAIALSHRFRVPSRLTSLLVLESEAMFRAFRIERSESVFEWTGESESHGTETTPVLDAAEKDDLGHALAGADGSASLGMLSGLASAETKARPRKASRAEEPVRPSGAPMDAAAGPSLAQGSGGGGFAQAPPPAPPHASTPPTFPGPPGRRGQWMRRVWFRTAAISEDGRPPVDASKLEAARAALAGAPDLRQRHADLARLLTRAGSAGELEAVADRWSTRDPLDPDLLTARAAARAWRGDREGALRILSGMLASPSTSSVAQADIASTLARAEERAVQPAVACALRVAAAESRPEDVATVAAAVACQRGQGEQASAERWIDAAKDEPTRTRLSSVAAKLLVAAKTEDPLFGDVSVDATWDDRPGVDLDIAVIDPAGRRLSWASAASRVRARDCTSRSHEALAISSGAAGAFVVEIVRADADGSTAPVRGSLRITSLGRTQVVPFVLVGDRQQVARVDVRFDSRLEPVNVWPAW